MNLPIQAIQPKTIDGKVARGIKPVAVVISTVTTEVIVAYFGEDNLLVNIPYGRFNLTTEEYANWGTDDNYITNLAIAKLDCVKA
jgi:hypothetical protein